MRRHVRDFREGRALIRSIGVTVVPSAAGESLAFFKAS